MRANIINCFGHSIAISMLGICTHIRVDSILYKINNIITQPPTYT